jgi:hypothetical protein
MLFCFGKTREVKKNTCLFLMIMIETKQTSKLTVFVSEHEKRFETRISEKNGESAGSKARHEMKKSVML